MEIFCWISGIAMEIFLSDRPNFISEKKNIVLGRRYKYKKIHQQDKSWVDGISLTIVLKIIPSPHQMVHKTGRILWMLQQTVSHTSSNIHIIIDHSYYASASHNISRNTCIHKIFDQLTFNSPGNTPFFVMFRFQQLLNPINHITSQ